jgi:hypothetical protein
MSKLKIYGVSDGRRYHVVAATSQVAAHAAFDRGCGFRVSMRDLKEYGFTLEGDAIGPAAATLDAPGSVLTLEPDFWVERARINGKA